MDWVRGFKDSEGMQPTREQIELAAYQRWQRREWGHGGDQDDWIAAERDLGFALNYRYVARYKLSSATKVLLGKSEAEASNRRRRCRFCEQAEPSAKFRGQHLALPALVGNTSLFAWDECDDCRAHEQAYLAGPFEDFARPLLDKSPEFPAQGIPVPALKALVRMALTALPTAELQHFGDTIEWVANPDHLLDSPLLGDLGCMVYRTPTVVPSASFALAKRVDEGAEVPYLVAFLALGSSRIVLQTHLPFCPRDEDFHDLQARGPRLSMSLGIGEDHRASDCAFVGVTLPETGRIAHRIGRHDRADAAATVGSGYRPHQ